MIGRRGGGDLQATVDRLARRVEELEGALARRGPELPAGAPGWQPDGTPVEEETDEPVSHQWLSILEPPVRHRRRLPRLPFEALFLVLVAVGVGVADLEPLWIAAVMGGAWALVALTEWSATLADRRRAEHEAIPPPALVPVTTGRPDQAWYIPPVEQTIAHGVFADGQTAVTRFHRPAADAEGTLVRPPADVETTIERRIADTQA